MERRRRREKRGIKTQKEIRTCIYQACQKKANHHGSVTTASGQFNFISSEANKRDPAEAPPTLETLNKTHQGETERQKWKRRNSTQKVCSLRRTNEVEICFPHIFKGRFLRTLAVKTETRRLVAADDVVICQNVIRHSSKRHGNLIKSVSVINGQIMEHL